MWEVRGWVGYVGGEGMGREWVGCEGVGGGDGLVMWEAWFLKGWWFARGGQVWTVNKCIH